MCSVETFFFSFDTCFVFYLNNVTQSSDIQYSVKSTIISNCPSSPLSEHLLRVKTTTKKKNQQLKVIFRWNRHERIAYYNLVHWVP